MEQTQFEPEISSELTSIEVASSRAGQAEQWLEENREAIEAYKAKQAEQGQTFAQWAGQL